MDRLMDELSPVTRLQVQVEGPPEVVRASLRALPGVTRVERRTVTDGVGTFVLEVERARDVRRELGQLVSQQHWGLLELRSLDLSLEDVFMRVIAGEPTGVPGEEVGAAEEEGAG
jgi:ABC-2 type transport system ATP-binding protein